jgi:hypothetical protein
MRQIIHLESSQVPATLRGAYAGHKFKAVVCESLTIPCTAGLWDGGSRDLYQAVDLATGQRHSGTFQNEAPWGDRKDREVALVPGLAIVEHSIFCGKDMGLTFYLHPTNAAALLPAPIELTSLEKLILEATRSLKSSYMGRDRYQMKLEDYRWSQDAKNGIPFPTREQWEQVKTDLIAKGFLNKAGAITVKGRNAAS